MAVQCTSDYSHSKDRAPNSFTNPDRVKTAHVAPTSRGPGSKTATRYSQITLLGGKGWMFGGGKGRASLMYSNLSASYFGYLATTRFLLFRTDTTLQATSDFDVCFTRTQMIKFVKMHSTSKLYLN